MSTFPIKPDPKATSISLSEYAFTVFLADGREITIPYEWFPKLRDATPEQRKEWGLIGRGIGIHWESLDEDISVANLLCVT